MPISEVSKTNGRPGIVEYLGVRCHSPGSELRYDRLQELVNHHNTLREMLGHGAFDDVTYHFQTKTTSLLTPELLDQINQLVVAAGHILVKKSPDEALRGRCDSFVLETHVHYPTDINLLWDAMRKSITLIATSGA
jgi:IS5 family transposase